MRENFEKNLRLGKKATLVLLAVLIITGLLFPTLVFSEGEKGMLLMGFTVNDSDESSGLPEGWDHLSYLGKAKNEVSLEKDGKKTIVRMKSLRSTSALLTRPEVSPKDYPILVWRWKVDRVVGMAVESRKDRNDCAARVRVIFGEKKTIPLEKNPLIEKLFDNFGITMPDVVEPSGFKIDYIWGNNVRKGDVIDYPGSKNHKMVVIQQGPEKTGRWIWEKRNIREDFTELFGGEPPGFAGVAVLSDTDHTNEGVEAYFGSIVLMKE
ncbi:MAG: DUF3047 domain-containing protein [Deltaproteobacteria bacterium]|nr:DUF3047 domain-containing protein [Deltaproteobacteria bacterium]